MYLRKTDIEQLDRVKRLNIINSISGIKPGNLIGTFSQEFGPNLAIISSVVHLGSDPALLGFIMRPDTEVRRQTYENIVENGYFTINHIHESFIAKAHYTSAKFAPQISEFDVCQLGEEYLEDFPAPFVENSQLKMGLKHVETVHIKSNDTKMIVGSIEYLQIPDQALEENGYINLEEIENIGISGLNTYYSLKRITSFPYARVAEIPIFTD